MGIDHYLPQQLKEYFKNNPMEGPFTDVDLGIYREDGIILYFQSINSLNARPGPDEAFLQTQGALISGVWQAADALMKLAPKPRRKNPPDFYSSTSPTSSASSVSSISYPSSFSSSSSSNSSPFFASSDSSVHSSSLTATSEFFRLSFDNASAGFYICPLIIGNQSYYLAIHYHNQTNPAWLKNKLRELVFKLEKNFEKNDEAKWPINQQSQSIEKNELGKKQVRKKLQTEQDKESVSLFENLTDDEVNHLFASLGH